MPPIIIPIGQSIVATMKMKVPIISKNVPESLRSKILIKTARTINPANEIISRIKNGFGFRQLCEKERINNMLPRKHSNMPGGLSDIPIIIAHTIDITLSIKSIGVILLIKTAYIVLPFKKYFNTHTVESFLIHRIHGTFLKWFIL